MRIRCLGLRKLVLGNADDKMFLWLRERERDGLLPTDRKKVYVFFFLIGDFTFFFLTLIMVE